MNAELPTLESREYLPALEWRFSGVCLGGWCHKRETCAHYRPGDAVSRPVERMCVGGAACYVPIEAEQMESAWPPMA